MRKLEVKEMDKKREEIIQKLVNNGIFKINDKQLYELPLYSIMKEYFIKVN